MARSSRGDVAFVLLLLQASAGVLGALGMAVLMASPLHAVPPLIGPVVQVVLAAGVARGRGLAWGVTIAMEVVSVYAFVANGALGLVPQIDVTVTVTGLLTRLCLPVALIVLGVLHFATPAERTPARAGGA